MANSTGIKISMRSIEEQLGSRRFAELEDVTLQIGEYSIKLDKDAQLFVLKQGIYRALYLPRYSKVRAEQAQALKEKQEKAIAQADEKLAIVRKVLKARGMSEEQIDAAFEKERKAQEQAQSAKA